MIEQCNCDQVLALKEKLRALQGIVNKDLMIAAAKEKFADTEGLSCCNGEITHSLIMGLDMDSALRELGDTALLMGNITTTDIKAFNLAYRYALHARIEDYVEGILFELEHD